MSSSDTWYIIWLCSMLEVQMKLLNERKWSSKHLLHVLAWGVPFSETLISDHYVKYIVGNVFFSNLKL